MSQPEPQGSEGVPQSSYSAAPVSRLNPNATAFVPSFQAAPFNPVFVPVYEHQPAFHPSRRGHPQYMYAPVYGSYPDAAMPQIFIEPSLNVNAQAFVPSTAAQPFDPAASIPEGSAASEASAPVTEVVDPSAPMTWAQRLKLSQSKASEATKVKAAAPAAPAKPAPVVQKTAGAFKADDAVKPEVPQATSEKAVSSKASPNLSPRASPKALNEMAEAVPEQQLETATVDDASDVEADDAKSSSSFEEVPGVDFERRIYSLKFLQQFRDYSDSSVPAKELIPAHLYVQHEEENLSWRASQVAGGRGGRGGGRTPMKVSGAVVEPLKRAENSWSALQHKLKTTSAPEEDERVERSIRGLLNKLTNDKYEKLKIQLFGDEIGMATFHQLSILIRLLFEKATQQHAFIPLYANLCRDCKEWLATTEGRSRFACEQGDVKEYFRRTLTEQCQEAFDSFLVVPVATIDGELNEEEVYAAEVKHRTKVWGNLKLIGQLIARRIISSKVAMKCINELLAQGDNETLLEALAVFLTDVARVIDTPNWEYHSKLEEVFKHLATLAFAEGDKKTVSSKCKFALQNLIDLRKANWQIAALAKVAVANKAAKTTAPAAARSGAWKPKINAAPVSTGAHKPSTAFKGWGKPLPGVTADEADSPKQVEEARRKSRTALEECRASRSQTDAVVSLQEALATLSRKAKVTVVGGEQLCFALEASSKDQELLFGVVAHVMSGESLEVTEVLDHFMDGPFEELKYDVPNATAIVRDKLLPLFSLDEQSKQSILKRLGL